MTDPIFDDETETCEGLDGGHLWVAAACVMLSALGGMLWLVLLVSPHAFH